MFLDWTLTTTLHVLDGLPGGLLALDARRLHERLTGPTLIHIAGRREPALFVSVLLHGNEDTGWEAMRILLARYADTDPPRSLSLFIGNVQAARARVRRLDGQPDFNRVWRGEGTPEHGLMRQVFEHMQERGVFASVDIHNNTGLNPHYACVNHLRPEFIHLASLFSRIIVYFTTPDTVQSRAFARLCPAVTLECGQPGQAHGVEHAVEFVDACLHLSGFPAHPVAPRDVDLFHTRAVVKVPARVSFGFGEGDGDVRFLEDLDRFNFRELPAGTLFGHVRGDALCLDVRDEDGAEVSDSYFRVEGDQVLTRVPVMPSMLTLDERVVRQDCLCYLMERYHL